jgi:hypothetical protein
MGSVEACDRRTGRRLSYSAANPARAALCGFKSIPVKSNDQGILSVETIAVMMDEVTAGPSMKIALSVGEIAFGKCCSMFYSGK